MCLYPPADFHLNNFTSPYVQSTLRILFENVHKLEVFKSTPKTYEIVSTIRTMIWQEPTHRHIGRFFSSKTSESSSTLYFSGATTIWVIADAQTKDGLNLIKNALLYVVSSINYWNFFKSPADKDKENGYQWRSLPKECLKLILIIIDIVEAEHPAGIPLLLFLRL